MTVRLVVRQRGEAEAGEEPNELMLEDALITIGRDAACQVVLAQKAVSRNHARISRDGGLHFIEDLGSAYGTQVNGKTLPKGEKRLLRNGDTIVIAQFDLTFDRIAELNKGTAGQSERTAFVARQAVKDVMRGVAGDAGEAPYLRIMNGPREGEHIELPEAKELFVGREGGGAEVELADDLVSRKHAKIRRDWSGTHVEDLGSRNGIRINKKKFDRRTLKDKDELEIGSTRMLFVDPSVIDQEAMSLAAEPSVESHEPVTNHNLAAQTPEEDEPAAEPEAPLNPIPSEPPAEEAAAAAEVPSAEEPPPDEESQLGEDAPLEEEPPVPAGPFDVRAILASPELRRKYGLLAAIAVVVLTAIGILITVVFQL